MTRGKKSFK